MAQEPVFKPKPGQVDYTDIRYCPVINTIVTHKDKILLQQRNKGMRLYPGYWSGISGFLDTADSLEDKVREELFEEAGITAEYIVSIERHPVLVQDAEKYGKTWIIFPMRAEVSTAAVTHNWEAEQLQWFSRHEIAKLHLLPGFEDVLTAVLP